MSNHIPDAGKMPADGFYSALVQCDTGGEIYQAVEVEDGKVFRPNGVELKPDACSDFKPIATWNYCYAWPVLAADELDRLRAAVRALHAELNGGKFAAIPVEDILNGKVKL
jgi:hypothetical protein